MTEERRIEMINFIVEQEKQECDWNEGRLRRYYERMHPVKLAEAYYLRGGK
jgi:hypothetical protein